MSLSNQYVGPAAFDLGFTLPASPTILPGDLLVVSMSRDSGSDTTPTGWTQIDSIFATGDGQRIITVAKIAGSGENSKYYASGGGQDFAYLINVYRGNDTTVSAAIDIAGRKKLVTNNADDAGSSNNYSIPAVTTTKPNAMLYAMFALDMTDNTETYTYTTPTGFGNQNSYDGINDNYENFRCWDKAQAVAGSSGAITSSINTTGVIGLAFAIYPASSSTPVRALISKSGVIAQVTDAELGTGKIAIKLPESGKYLVYDTTNKCMREITSSESLLI